MAASCLRTPTKTVAPAPGRRPLRQSDWDSFADICVAILRTEAGSPSEEGLRLLASWIATPEQGLTTVDKID